MHIRADLSWTALGAPSRLIASLQHVTGLSSCLHDYTGGALSALVGHDALNHLGPFCSLAKRRSAGGERACVACDSGLVQSRLAGIQTCFVKQCHAGVCELVILMYHNGMPAGALFVGPFRWPADLPLPGNALVQPAGRGGGRAMDAALAELPETNESRLQHVAALARLVAIHIERSLSAGGSADDVEGRGYELRIRDFFAARSAGPVRLDDLARHLFLSRSRTSQLVRKHFATTFPRLLLDHRLTRAKSLLAGSHLTVTSVARSVGFEDVTYFHRVFKRQAGTTPARYRRVHWRGGDETAV